MKNTLLAGVCAAALTLAAPAASQAQDMSNGWYISMFGGLSAPKTMKGTFILDPELLNEKDKFKSGSTVGLAIGKSITENVRGEVEFAFARHKPKSSVLTGVKGSFTRDWTGDIKSYTILGNLWYDFNNTSQFTPYLGGGIGFGIIDSNLTGSDPWRRTDSDVALAFQLGAGVNIALSQSVSLGLGYRLKGIVDFELKQTPPDVDPITTYKDLDLYTHNFLANVTFKFNGP